MTDINLRQRLGVQLHTPHEGQIKGVVRDLRFKQTAVTLNWNYFELVEGEFNFGWFDGIVADLKKYTTEPPVAWLFRIPAWIDPTQKPRGEEANPHIAYLPPDKVFKWETAVYTVVSRYKDYIKYWNLDCEINVAGAWNATPEEYAKNVLIPAAKIIHSYGGKVVAPGITIQRYESKDHYFKAKDHMRRILDLAGPYIDCVSIHSYGKSANRVIEQIKSFSIELGLRRKELWLTEVGFPETHYWLPEDWLSSLLDLFKTGKQRQLERLQKFIPFIESTSWIKRTIYWRGFDVSPKEAERHSTNGLLNFRLKPKPAGLYVKEELRADRT